MWGRGGRADAPLVLVVVLLVSVVVGTWVRHAKLGSESCEGEGAREESRPATMR